MTARRYTVAIDGRTFTIDVAETASDAFEVAVDGRHFSATLSGDPDGPAVAIGSAPTLALTPPPIVASDVADVGASSVVRATAVGGAPPDTAAAVAEIRPGSARPTTAPSGCIAAPMPGAILEVRVAPGATVRRGDGLLVLEAMKMRNVIRAPREATVVEVLVEPGAQVAAGDPLVRFGPPRD